MIEGELVAGSNCLVVEDVVTSGGSVLETCDALKQAGIIVTHCVVLVDREQGGRDNIAKGGVALTSVLTLSQLLQYLLDANKISMETVTKVKAFLKANAIVPPPSILVQDPAVSLLAFLTSQTPPVKILCVT